MVKLCDCNHDFFRKTVYEIRNRQNLQEKRASLVGGKSCSRSWAKEIIANAEMSSRLENACGLNDASTSEIACGPFFLQLFKSLLHTGEYKEVKNS